MAGNRLEVTRSGGLAGIVAQASLNLDLVGDEETERLLRALADLPDHPDHLPAGADRFQYDLVLTQSAGVRRVRLYDDQVPEAIRALIGRAFRRESGE